MSTIKPFGALLPVKDKIHLVPSRSYFEYTDEQLKNKLESNPYTFLHVINPDYGSDIHLNDSLIERFKRVRLKFKHFVKDKVFHLPYDNCLYIYQQIKDGHSYTGIIGGASVDEYLSGQIKIHEKTIKDRKVIFKDYLYETKINAEPVLLTYEDNSDVDELVDKYLNTHPEFEFESSNNVTHKLWVVDNLDHVNRLQSIFKNQIESIYIADGHHRSASSAMLCEHLREQNPDYTGEENFNFFMAYYIPQSQLKISNFNRIVKDLNGLSPDEFLNKLEKDFDVEKINLGCYNPKSVHNFSMFLDYNWYSLYPKVGTFNSNHPVKKLDVSILNKNILQPILGIEDLTTDHRISYLGHQYQCDELITYMDKHNYKVGFVLYPCTVDQMKLVADTQNTMPPKSTYIEPKLRSGLTIYTLIDEQRNEG